MRLQEPICLSLTIGWPQLILLLLPFCKEAIFRLLVMFESLKIPMKIGFPFRF